MRRTWLVLVLAVGLWPLLSAAVVRDHFLARTTQDFVEVCSTDESDPLHAAAIGFCQGFLLGAYQYYLAVTSVPGGKPFVCLPDPPPTRVEGLQMFLAWARENPQYMGELPVESLFRFLTAKWPCRP